MKRVFIAVVASLLAASAANAAGGFWPGGGLSGSLPNGKHWSPFR
nr:hypothetical protein [Mesorhizobium loti]